MTLFDRPRQRQLKARAAMLNYEKTFFLSQEVQKSFLERLQGVRFKPRRILVLTPADETFALTLKVQGWGQDFIICVHSILSLGLRSGQEKEIISIVGDEEQLPFQGPGFDLILSCLGMHRVNGVPSMLTQCRELLQPGGLFLAAFYGGESLFELRTALLEAELEVTGGAAPRLHPTITGENATRLLNGAGFILPVVDRDRYTLLYSGLGPLFQDLRDAGEGNSLTSRTPLRRDVLALAAHKYQHYFTNAEGQLPATVEILFLTGWG